MAIPLANQPTTLPHVTMDHLDASHLSDRIELHVQGYPKLAFFFSRGSRYLHLRRFSTLAVRNLLYRQHELMELERKILQLEERDYKSNSPVRRDFCRDFALLRAAPAETSGHAEQRELYKLIESKMKEYEKALIRFDRLGAKGYGKTELKAIQWFLDHPNGTHCSLLGLDASVWVSISNPLDYASDLIQVVEQPRASAMGAFLQNRFLRWGPCLPKWLWRPDTLRLHNFSNRASEVISLSLGNLFTSILVYGAVCLLYFTNGKAAGIVGVVCIATVATTCSVLFRNQQFISMLSTLCAVLVTLLLKNNNQREFTEPTLPRNSSMELR